MEPLTNLKARVLIKFYDANAPLDLQMQVFLGAYAILDANASFSFMMHVSTFSSRDRTYVGIEDERGVATNRIVWVRLATRN